MATFDWPDALIPQTAQLGLLKAGTQFVSPFNGSTQAADFVAERWTLSASLAEMAARNPRGVHAFCNRLAGGVNRVRAWHFGHNGGLPLGTLRGSPVLSAPAVRGQATMAVAGAAAGANLLVGGGFENDTSGDGVADLWAPYQAGSVSAPAWTMAASSVSPTAQRMTAATLGAAAGDIVGVVRQAVVPVQPFARYSYAASFFATSAAVQVALYVEWYSAASAFLGVAQQSWAGPAAQWTRHALQDLQAPAGAAGALCFALMRANTGGANPAVWVDNAQFEPGAVATPFAGSPTVRADDMLGLAGHLLQVASDVQLLDNGTGTVPVVNRIRGAIALGAPVVWYRPTAEFVMPAMQSAPVHRPGAIESVALDLVERWD